MELGSLSNWSTAFCNFEEAARSQVIYASGQRRFEITLPVRVAFRCNWSIALSSFSGALGSCLARFTCTEGDSLSDAGVNPAFVGLRRTDGLVTSTTIHESDETVIFPIFKSSSWKIGLRDLSSQASIEISNHFIFLLIQTSSSTGFIIAINEGIFATFLSKTILHICFQLSILTIGQDVDVIEVLVHCMQTSIIISPLCPAVGQLSIGDLGKTDENQK